MATTAISIAIPAHAPSTPAMPTRLASTTALLPASALDLMPGLVPGSMQAPEPDFIMEREPATIAGFDTVALRLAIPMAANTDADHKPQLEACQTATEGTAYLAVPFFFHGYRFLFSPFFLSPAQWQSKVRNTLGRYR